MIDNLLSANINPRQNWLTADSVRSIVQNPQIDSVGDGVVPKGSKKDKKNEKIGHRLVKIAILTAACGFVGLKGSTRKARSKLDQAIKNLTDGNDKDKSFIRFNVRKGMIIVGEWAKAIFNLAPLKDVLISKAMDKNPITKKISENVTKWFEHVSKRTVRRAYTRSYEKIEQALALFELHNTRLKTTHPDQVELIEALMDKIRIGFRDNFTDMAWQKRLRNLKDKFDGKNDENKALRDLVWDKTYHKAEGLRHPDLFKHFISEQLTAKDKLKYAEEVDVHKLQIANSLRTLCQDGFELLIHIDKFITADDKATRDIIKNIANGLKDYKTEISSGHTDGMKVFEQTNIVGHLKDLKSRFEGPTQYNKGVVLQTQQSIEKLIYRVQNHKRGALNQILHIYRTECGLDGDSPEFKHLLKVKDKAEAAFEKAVDMETDKMFDKIRDLKIGTAPKDVLLLMTPIGAVGYELSKVNSNDDRISVGVKYGVPIVGAVAITMYCTVGLVSAGPSLLIGFLSGLALNQVGNVLDDVIKEYNAEHKKNKPIETKKGGV